MPLRDMVTTRTHRVFAIAHRLAASLGHDEVTPAHVVHGILREEVNVAAQLLLHVRGIDRSALERELDALLPPRTTTTTTDAELRWSGTDEAILERAAAESRELGTEYIGCEHVLLALLRDPSHPVGQVFKRHGIGFDTVRTDLQRIHAEAMKRAADQDSGGTAD